MTRTLAILAFALTLSACATLPPDATPKQKADVAISNIDFVYFPAMLSAKACVSGVICSDATVRDIVSKAIPIVEEAYTNGVAFILANADDATKIAARKKAVMDAVTTLMKALASYGVKL